MPKTLEICRNCGTELPVEDSARDPSKACGYKRLCRACDNEKAKAYYHRNREKRLVAMAERRAAVMEAKEATGWRGRRSGRPGA
jgi:predicted Zn-dependent protease